MIDRRQAALNHVNELCLESADQYDYAAELVDDDAMGGLFRELGARRREISRVLEDHIRGLGLPKEPDPEKETVERVMTRVKALLSPDRRQTLLRERERDEQELARRVVAALQEDLPGEVRTFLREILDEIGGTQERLGTVMRRMTG